MTVRTKTLANSRTWLGENLQSEVDNESVSEFLDVDFEDLALTYKNMAEMFLEDDDIDHADPSDWTGIFLAIFLHGMATQKMLQET